MNEDGPWHRGAVAAAYFTTPLPPVDGLPDRLPAPVPSWPYGELPSGTWLPLEEGTVPDGGSAP